ncbi:MULTISPECIES: SDR family oxidoreductase [Parafrankia]|uniref:SDR family oxidoreductase n=1 Tax=Parafrankia TaxID=2994362 RepID=UPI000A4D7359|nr:MULTISPECIES: SDR family oxidoreductase [Parafrankia]
MDDRKRGPARLAARRADRLAAVAAEIRALGREPLSVPTDITDAGACQRLGGWGVRVNGVFLGPVLGENLERLGAGAAAAGTSVEAWLRTKATEMPLGIVPSPDQCAGAVLFLASDLASVVTGQHLAVNGGQWLS